MTGKSAVVLKNNISIEKSNKAIYRINIIAYLCLTNPLKSNGKYVYHVI